MKNFKDLQIWDSIRILSVPEFDLNKNNNSDDELNTESIIKKIINVRPVVIIDEIDEYWKPWFYVRLKTEQWLEFHSIALMENDSWELVYAQNSDWDIPIEHSIATVEKQIDEIMEKYDEEYENLAEKSEKLYGQQQELEKEYEDLDKITWLNSLFEKLAELKD
mgnify:FL=1